MRLEPINDMKDVKPASMKLRLEPISDPVPDSMSTKGVIGYAKEHPFKTVLDPAIKTATGKSLEDRAVDYTQSKDFSNTPKNRPFDRNLNQVKGRAFDTVLSGQVADQATTPANYIGGKLIEPVAKGIATGVKGAGKFIANTINRSKPDYLNTDVIPNAIKTFKDSISNGSASLHSLLESKGIIPKSASETLKKFGENDINLAHDKNMGSTDPIVSRIKNGISQKSTQADNAYRMAVEGFKGQIDSSKFMNSIKSSLESKGWIDKLGNPTTRYKGGISPTYDKLTDLYQDLKPAKGIKGNVLSREDFSTYRDALGDMLKEKPSDIAIQKARNSLYDSAEYSGMKGIKSARDLEKKAFEFERKNINRNTGELKIKESNLDKYHSMSESDKRSLQNIENYTGKPFIDDLSKITAKKHIDNIDKKISELVSKGENPKNTSSSLKELGDLVGKDNANKIMREVVAQRRIKKLSKGASLLGAAELARKGITGSF